jgi:murein DD-endopeptidase MepM/ murein hydrolase activator NlpD
MKEGQVQFKIQRRKRKHLILSLLVLACAVILFIVLSQFDRQKPDPVPVGITAPAVPAPQAPTLAEYRTKIRPGDTIGRVLGRYGFSPADVQVLYDQVRPVFDLRRLRAGQLLRVYADPSGAVVRLEYDVDDFNFLAVEKDKSSGRTHARTVDTTVNMISGSINESLIVAFDQIGEEDLLALAFADLFGWDVDFYIDLRPGDGFKVIFERKYLEGKFIGYGRILAAEITNQGRTLQAFFYVYPENKKAGYYDAEGKSLEKEFRKSPIKWARITSRFSGSRLHPIHKVYRAHYGWLRRPINPIRPRPTGQSPLPAGTGLPGGWSGFGTRTPTKRCTSISGASGRESAPGPE